MMKRIKRWLHEIYEEDIKFFGQMNGMYFRQALEKENKRKKEKENYEKISKMV